MTNIHFSQREYFEQEFNDISIIKKKVCSKEFFDCVFTECDFSESIFSKCSFHDCTFIGCNLSLLSINNSTFANTSFEDCKIIGINWTTAEWPQIKLCSPIQFYKCILNESSFFGLYLSEIKLVECKAHYVDFRETDCEEADFSYTDLSYSIFNKTNLCGANFNNATNYNIDIFNNHIKHAKFTLPEAIQLLNSLEIEIID